MTSVNDKSGLTLKAIRFTGAGYTVSGNSIALNPMMSTPTSTVGLSFSITATGSQSNTISFTALTLEAAQSFEVTGSTTPAANATLNVTSQIGGSSALTKIGNGTLVLSGANIYDAPTTVSAGTLSISNSSALGTAGQGTTVTSGATLDVIGGISSAEPVTLNGVGVSSSTGALNNSSGSPTMTGPITLAIDSNIGSAGNLTISGVIGESGGPKALTKVGAGTLVLPTANTYSGLTTVSAGVLRIQNPSALGTVGSGTTAGTGGSLEIDGGINCAELLTLNGTGDSSSTGALRNVSGSNTWSGTISLSGSPTIGGSAGSLTVSGVISGSGSLTKLGTGTLVLPTANTYNGVTTIGTDSAGGGVLRIQNASALGTLGSNTVVKGSSTLEIDGGITSAEPLDLKGTGDSSTGALRNGIGSNTFSGNITLSASSTVGVDSGTLTLSGAISGSTFGLTKIGAGTLTLSGSGSNTYNGGTTVDAGFLELAKTSGNAVTGTVMTVGGGSSANVTLLGPGLDQIGDSVTVTVNSSSLLALNGVTDTVNGLRLAGGSVTTDGTTTDATLTLAGGNVTSTATSSISGHLALGVTGRTFDVSSGTLTVGAEVSGSGGITKNGSGTMVLEADNLFSGAVTVAAGILDILSGGALGTTSAGTSVASGATLQVDGGETGITSAEPINLSGAGVASMGALRNGSGVNTMSGLPITLTSDSTVGADADTLTISGAIGESGGARALTKTGAGTLVLPSANTYSGATNVSVGVLRIQNASALGMATIGTTVTAGALEVQGGITSAEPLTLNGSGIGGNGALRSLTGANTMSASVALGTTSTVGVDVNSLTLSGVISGTGNGLTKAGAGTLTLSGGSANTYTGATTVNAGILQLNKSSGNAVAGSLTVGDGAGSDTAKLLAANQVADGAAVTVNSSGLLDLNGFNDTVGSLALTGPGGVTTGAGALTLGGGAITTTGSASSATISGSLTLGSANSTATVADGAAADDLVISATVGGSAGLLKAGSGRLVLNGNNTYSGVTTVDTGALFVNGSQPSSTMTVSGGTLGGTGTTGPVSADGDGGTVNPGTSPGILNTGNATFNATTTFVSELNGTTAGSGYDQLNVAGTVDLGGATLSATLGYTPNAGDSFVIVNNDGADAITGTFAGLAQGSTFSAGGATFSISYTGGMNGNDVVLSTVSAPSPPPPPPGGANLSGWESLGGDASSAPGAASWAPGRLDVFMAGADGDLQHKWFDGSWHGFESLGGVLDSDPAAISWGPNRIDVFVKGTDDQLYHKWWDGVSWKGWEALGGVLTSSPAVTTWGPGRLDVLVRGTDGGLYHKWFNGAWSGWEPLGGVLDSDPDAVAWGSGRIDVFTAGTDGQLWHKWFNGAWSGWEPLGGVLDSGPGVSSWAAGRLDVFVAGTDGQLYHKWFDGAWHGFEHLNGSLISDPDPISWGPGRVDVFAIGEDFSLVHKWFNGTWNP